MFKHLLLIHSIRMQTCNRYEKSALLYSHIEAQSFEEIALKFLQLADKRPLRLLLQKKLELLQESDDAQASESGLPPPRQKTQLVVWLIWLVELFLNEIALLKDRPPHLADKGAQPSLSADKPETSTGSTISYGQLFTEFKAFLGSKSILVIRFCFIGLKYWITCIFHKKI